MEDYSKHDATGLAELVRKGETTPSELLEEAITSGPSLGFSGDIS